MCLSVCIRCCLQGGIGLRLRTRDGHAAVGGFTTHFCQQHPATATDTPSPNSPCSSTSLRAPSYIEKDDIIVAVGNLDVLSPQLSSFDKVGVGHARTSAAL